MVGRREERKSWLAWQLYCHSVLIIIIFLSAWTFTNEFLTLVLRPVLMEQNFLEILVKTPVSEPFPWNLDWQSLRRGPEICIRTSLKWFWAHRFGSLGSRLWTTWELEVDLSTYRHWPGGEQGGRTIDSTDMNLSKLQQIVEDRGIWHATVHGVTESDTT